MCVLYSSLSSLHIHAHLQSSVKRPRKKMKIGCVTLSQQPIFDRKLYEAVYVGPLLSR